MPEPTAQTPAPSTPTTPAAPTAPTPKPDVADVAAQDSAIKALLGTKKKEKKETPAAPAIPDTKPATVSAKPDTEPTPAPQTPSAPPAAPTTPVAQPLKVRKPKPQEPQLTPSQIADIAAQSAAKVIQPQQPTASAPAVELPEALDGNAALYEQLEKINPAKYKGIAKKAADKYTDFVRKELAYAEQWENAERQRLQAEGKLDPANPPAFDAEDPQHAHFYNRNSPNVDIDPRDAQKAEFRLMYQEESKPLMDELNEARGTIKSLKAAPAAAQSVDQFRNSMLSSLNPEAKGEITAQNYKTWSEASPLEAEIAEQINNQVAPVVHAASLLWDGAINIDQNNQNHTVAAQAFQRFEQTLDAHRDQLVDSGGRQWVPLAEYSKMSPQQQRQHFTTTKDKFINYLGLEAASQVRAVAQSQLENYERVAKRLGYQKAQVPSMTPQTPAATPSAPAPVLASPSVSSGAPTPPSAGAAPAPVVNGRSNFANLLGSK